MTQEIWNPTVHLSLNHSEKSRQALFLLELTNLPYETTYLSGDDNYVPAISLGESNVLFSGLKDVELLVGTLSPEVYTTWLQNGRPSKDFQLPRRQ